MNHKDDDIDGQGAPEDINGSDPPGDDQGDEPEDVAPPAPPPRTCPVKIADHEARRIRDGDLIGDGPDVETVRVRIEPDYHEALVPKQDVFDKYDTSLDGTHQIVQRDGRTRIEWVRDKGWPPAGEVWLSNPDNRRFHHDYLVMDNPAEDTAYVQVKSNGARLFVARSRVFPVKTANAKEALSIDGSCRIAESEAGPYLKIEEVKNGRGKGKPGPARTTVNYPVLSDEELGLTRLSEVKEGSVRWLWKYRLARAQMALLAGEGGEGKSLFLLACATAVSVGGPWPDGSGPAPLGDVIIVAAEDDPETTIRTRLRALGADLDRIHIVRASVTIRAADGSLAVNPQSLQDLGYWREVLLRLPGCKLIIIDPVPSYLGRGVDDHRNMEVRRVLEQFILNIVRPYNLCMYCNTHFNKSSDANTPIQRIIGSIAYANLARNVHVICRDPDDRGRRIWQQDKCNGAPEGLSAVAFRIGVRNLVSEEGEEIETAVPEFEAAPVAGIDLQAAINGKPHKPREKGEEDQAAEWLGEFLADGPVESSECARQGDAHLGHPWTDDMDDKARNGRIKYWRERVPKARLGGRSAKSPEFQGKWMFTIPGHGRGQAAVNFPDPSSLGDVEFEAP
jgi:hypothetical protein